MTTTPTDTTTETTRKGRRRSAGTTARRATVRHSRIAAPFLTLVEDHRRVDTLLERATRDGVRSDTLARLVEEISEELAVHAGIEEMVLYPAARAALDAGPSTDDREVLEALEEHHVVKQLLAELARTPVADERFRAKVQVLSEMVRHHVTEEEKELFPTLSRVIPREQLDAIAVLLDEARLVAPRMAHPHAPDQPPGNLVVTALTLPIDLVGKVVSRVIHRAGR